VYSFKKLKLFVCSFFLLQLSISQTYTTGLVEYKSVLTAGVQAGGGKMTEKVDVKMELSIAGKNYKITASPKASPTSGIQFGDMKLYKYYDAETNAVYSITPFRGVEYAVSNMVAVSDIKETGITKEILGYLSHQFTCTFNGKPAKGWYAKTLPAIISAEGNLGLPGMLMLIESELVMMEVVKIDWNVPVKETEARLPAVIKKMSREEYEELRKKG
jgi:GLPGLI family protein